MTRSCYHHHGLFGASPLCERGQHRCRATPDGASPCCAVLCSSMLCLHASALLLLLRLPLSALFPPLWPPLPIHAVLCRAPSAAVFVAVDVGNAVVAVEALAMVRGGCRGHARACSYRRSRGCSRLQVAAQPQLLSSWESCRTPKSYLC